MELFRDFVLKNIFSIDLDVQKSLKCHILDVLCQKFQIWGISYLRKKCILSKKLACICGSSVQAHLVELGQQGTEVDIEAVGF